LQWVFNDGGRQAAGYKGEAGDCVCRAIAIAACLPYQQVYDALNQRAKQERPSKQRRGHSSARIGVHRPVYEAYLKELGWRWVTTMRIGQDCKVHLCREELPVGRLIVSVSRHIVAVLDGVVHDTHDPGRGGTRCVYGYYVKPA
jgi:hypothetical protein